MALGKEVPKKDFELGVSGALTDEKLQTLRVNWVKHLQKVAEPLADLSAMCLIAMPADDPSDTTILDEVTFKYPYDKSILN